MEMRICEGRDVLERGKIGRYREKESERVKEMESDRER